MTSNEKGTKLKRKQKEEAIKLLKGSVMFRYCSDENLSKIADRMTLKTFKPGEILIHQDEKSTHMFIVWKGSVIRLRKDEANQIHQVDTKTCGTSVNSLHLLREEPCFATAQAHSPVSVFELTSTDFNSLLDDASLAKEVVYSLSKEIRNQTKLLRTPLLEQRPKEVHHPFYVNTVAATVESFYRSALNSVLNARLSGKQAALFPNMHIQIPSRIFYINGFKGLRLFLDETVIPETYDNPQLARLGIAITPGVCMTPLSSLLEASNAGHANPEPMHFRMWRGLAPRTTREIIFGIGLNQLSDFCEERVAPIVKNPTLRNAAGSLIAGVISGYLSHVPHNLSAMKLMHPQKSYPQLFFEFSDFWKKRLPPNFPMKSVSSALLSIVLPKGVSIRTTQIVGSFILLNGIINALKSL